MKEGHRSNERRSQKDRGPARPMPVTMWTDKDRAAGMQQIAKRFGVTVTPGEEKTEMYTHPRPGSKPAPHQKQHVVIQPHRQGEPLTPFYGAAQAAARHIRRHRGKKPQ